MSRGHTAFFDTWRSWFGCLLDLPENCAVRLVVDVEQEAGEPKPDAERAEWLAHSGRTARKGWENPEDDVYTVFLKR